MKYTDLNISKTNLLDENNKECIKFNNFNSFNDLNEIFDNCNKDKRIVVFHHNDNDGIFSATLVKEYFDRFKNINFVLCDYVNNVPKEEDIKDDDIVFIVDYKLNYPIFNYCVKKAKCTIWVDHHETSINEINTMKNLYVSEEKYNTVKVFCSSAKSATALIYELIDGALPINKLTIKLIDMYDRWVDPNNPLPFYLNSFTGISSDIFVSNKESCNTVKNLLYSTEEELKKYVDIGQQFYQLNETKNKLVCTNFSKMTSFKGYNNCIVIKGHGNSLLFGTDISKYDICIVYFRTFTGKYKYSLFTANDAIDVSKIAEAYNGGGHKKAAGFTINTDIFA